MNPQEGGGLLEDPSFVFKLGAKSKLNVLILTFSAICVGLRIMFIHRFEVLNKYLSSQEMHYSPLFQSLKVSPFVLIRSSLKNINHSCICNGKWEKSPQVSTVITQTILVNKVNQKMIK